MHTKFNRHEMRIKKLCANWIEKLYSSRTIYTLVNEFSANKSAARADMMAIVGEEIIAIEIKSENDSLSRLDRQINILKKFYNRVEVVVAENHLKTARPLCRDRNVGLHVAKHDEISTILRGHGRRVSPEALISAFPQKIRKRADFEPTEAYYKKYLKKKYGIVDFRNVHKDKSVEPVTDTFIRSLNPSFRATIAKQESHQNYIEDLKRSFERLQSTHSSSSSSAEIASP